MIVTAELKWADGQQFVGRIDEGSVLVIDAEEGGSGDGPMKLILMGVSGCAVMDVVSILKKSFPVGFLMCKQLCPIWKRSKLASVLKTDTIIYK